MMQLTFHMTIYTKATYDSLIDLRNLFYSTYRFHLRFVVRSHAAENKLIEETSDGQIQRSSDVSNGNFYVKPTKKKKKLFKQKEFL